MNVKLDTGQYDYISNGYILGFLRSGLTIACCWHAGKVDVLHEQFITEATTEDRTSQHCLTSHIGAGSSSHCFHVAQRSDAATS